mgnify:CR=1 FL=1
MLQIFNLNILSASTVCVLPLTPQQTLVSGFLLPFVSFCQFLLIFAASALAWLVAQRTDWSVCSRWFTKGEPFDVNPFRRTALAILLFSFNTVLQTCFAYFGARATLPCCNP